MSIVNISSENKVSGTDAEFAVNLKRPLQRCIGVQILNVTVPLSYNIINDENKNVLFTDGGTSRTASLTNGTYSPQEMAKELANAMNVQNGVGFVNKSQKMIDLCNDNNRLEFDLQAGSNNKLSDTHADQIEALGLAQDLSGLEIKTSGGAYHHIVQYNSSTASAVLHSGSTVTLDNTYKVSWEGVFVKYDDVENCFIIASHDAIQLLTSNNSTRMLKTLGFTGSEGNTTTASLGSNHKYKKLGNGFQQGSQTPELSGPSMLFLRLGGDMILDQQNSETNMNDRIPIPIDQPHGSVVHYENDSEADVIPMSVPCDVRKITCRLEYGDDNTLVGGDTANLRGHHAYVRFKFYKQHEKL